MTSGTPTPPPAAISSHAAISSRTPLASASRPRYSRCSPGPERRASGSGTKLCFTASRPAGMPARTRISRCAAEMQKNRSTPDHQRRRLTDRLSASGTVASREFR
ncbi:hypothetical protein STENM223S_11493 [Streptomyces tendae]